MKVFAAFLSVPLLVICLIYAVTAFITWEFPVSFGTWAAADRGAFLFFSGAVLLFGLFGGLLFAAEVDACSRERREAKE